MDNHPLIQLLARAIVSQARRQVQENAAQVLAHQGGDAPEETPCKETPNASPFYPTGETSAI